MKNNQHLLLDNGMKNSMNISGHTLGITTDVKITSLRNQTPQLCSLHIKKLMQGKTYPATFDPH